MAVSGSASNTGALLGGSAPAGAGGDIMFVGNPKTNTGIIRPGGPDGEILIDPLELSITDASDLSGEKITLVAKDTMTIGSLINTPAIDAVDTLELVVAPGGTLDLRNNLAGEWLRAGTSIVLKADTIQTDPGIVPADLMNPAPSILPGETYTSLFVGPPTFSATTWPGSVVTLPLEVMNSGTEPLTVQITTQDTALWLQNPISQAVSLDALEAYEGEIEIHVPTTACVGDETIVTLTGDAGSIIKTETLTFTVPVMALHDSNCDGIVDLVDYIEFATCMLGPGADIVDPLCECFDSDFNDFVDLADFVVFQSMFTVSP